MYMMRAGEAHIFSSEQSDRLVALISVANLVVDISFLSFNLHSQAANVESWDKFLCSSFLHHTLSHFNWMQGWTQAFAIGLFPMVFQSFWPLWFIISYCFCIHLVGIGVSFFFVDVSLGFVMYVSLTIWSVRKLHSGNNVKFRHVDPFCFVSRAQLHN